MSEQIKTEQPSDPEQPSNPEQPLKTIALNPHDPHDTWPLASTHITKQETDRLLFNDDSELQRRCNRELEQEIKRTLPENLKFVTGLEKRRLVDFCVKFVETHQSLFANCDFTDDNTLKATRTGLRQAVVRIYRNGRQQRRQQRKRQDQSPSISNSEDDLNHPTTTNTVLPSVEPSIAVSYSRIPPIQTNPDQGFRRFQLEPVPSVVPSTAAGYSSIPAVRTHPEQESQRSQLAPTPFTAPSTAAGFSPIPAVRTDPERGSQRSQPAPAPPIWQRLASDDIPWSQIILKHTIQWRGQSHNHNWLLAFFLSPEQQTKAHLYAGEDVFTKWVTRVQSRCYGISVFGENRVFGVDEDGTKNAIWDYADWVTHIFKCYERRLRSIEFLIDVRDRGKP